MSVCFCLFFTEKPLVTRVRVPGDSVQLSCRSRCSRDTTMAGDDSENARLWLAYSSESNTYQPLVFPSSSDLSSTSSFSAVLSGNTALTSGAGVYLTHDGSLVMTNVTTTTQLRCQIGSVLVAEHLVDVPGRCLLQSLHNALFVFYYYCCSFRRPFCTSLEGL